MSVDLNWTPSVSTSIGQIAEKRLRGTLPWDNTGFTPPNTLSSVANTTVATGTSNFVYELRVSVLCDPFTITAGTIVEGIEFSCDPSLINFSYQAPAGEVGVEIRDIPIDYPDIVEVRVYIYDDQYNLEHTSAPIAVTNTIIYNVPGFTPGTTHYAIIQYRALVNGVMVESSFPIQSSPCTITTVVL